MTRFLITAGPTVEDLDPVRFLSNRSSGKLGFALARAAARAGNAVTLVHGPVANEVLRTAPKGSTVVAVRSAAQMTSAVFQHVRDADVVIMNAAVADFTPTRVSVRKISKEGCGLTLELKPTMDILKALGKYKNDKRPELVLIGFALETGSGRTEAKRQNSAERNAIDKITRKNLDAIVLNSPKTIGAADGDFLLIVRAGLERHPLAGDKETLAKTLIRVATKMQRGSQTK